MKKLEPYIKLYAIVAGFVLISVLQIVHAISDWSSIKNLSANGQSEKTKTIIAKPNLFVPGTMIQSAREH